MTSPSRRRRAVVACFSHAWLKRWISLRTGTLAAAGLDEHRERAAGVDGLQLGIVADQEHLRADVGGQAGDPVRSRPSAVTRSVQQTRTFANELAVTDYDRRRPMARGRPSPGEASPDDNDHQSPGRWCRSRDSQAS